MHRSSAVKPSHLDHHRSHTLSGRPRPDCWDPQWPNADSSRVQNYYSWTRCLCRRGLGSEVSHVLRPFWSCKPASNRLVLRSSPYVGEVVSHLRHQACVEAVVFTEYQLVESSLMWDTYCEARCLREKARHWTHHDRPCSPWISAGSVWARCSASRRGRGTVSWCNTKPRQT